MNNNLDQKGSHLVSIIIFMVALAIVGLASQRVVDSIRNAQAKNRQPATVKDSGWKAETNTEIISH